MSCWRISILQQSEVIPSISAAFVRTTTTSHSTPAMVAIGFLGDEANRNQLRTTRWNPMATAQESRSYATQTRLRRGFPISPLVCGEISSNRTWYRSYQDAGTTDLAEAGDTRAHSHVWGMLTAQRTIRRGGVQMTRLERGFYDGNGEFVRLMSGLSADSADAEL